MQISIAKRRQIREAVSRIRSAPRWRPRLQGGITEGHHPREVPAIALRRGAAVELEHTRSVPTAIEIAFGHLLERVDYYERLPD